LCAIAFRHCATLFFTHPLRPAAGIGDGASKLKHVDLVFVAFAVSRRKGQGQVISILCRNPLQTWLVVGAAGQVG